MKLVITILFLTSCFQLSAQKNCLKYKTGAFLLTDIGMNIQNKIERVGDKQFETDLKTGRITTFNVKWLNDCEYELNIVSGPSEMVKFYQSKTLIVRILEVYADGYKFEGHIKGSYIYKSNILKAI